jgi:hypothetical protein
MTLADVYTFASVAAQTDAHVYPMEFRKNESIQNEK